MKNAVTSFLNVRLQAGASDMISAILFDNNAREEFVMRPLRDCA